MNKGRAFRYILYLSWFWVLQLLKYKDAATIPNADRLTAKVKRFYGYRNKKGAILKIKSSRCVLGDSSLSQQDLYWGLPIFCVAFRLH